MGESARGFASREAIRENIPSLRGGKKSPSTGQENLNFAGTDWINKKLLLNRAKTLARMLYIPLGYAGTLGSVQWLILAFVRVFPWLE